MMLKIWRLQCLERGCEISDRAEGPGYFLALAVVVSSTGTGERGFSSQSL